MNNIKTIIPFLIVFMCIFQLDAQEQVNEIKNYVTYYQKRNQAFVLIKNKKWQETRAVLKSLIQQNKEDGDLFYLLGIAEYQIKNYEKSIEAFKNSLKLGGTILREIPTGSAPSNDVMIRIAKAYALNGDKQNMLVWLKKGFAARYDEKPFLKSSSAFKKYEEDEDFLKLFGVDTELNPTRNEAWKIDIDYLLSRIKQLHFDMDNTISKVDFDNLKNDLLTTISQSTDEQIVFKIMRLFGELGSGHNIIIPTSPKLGALKQLPVQFYQFNDGIFIVDAKKGFEKWIGYKVEFIGDMAVQKALKLTDKLNARDNNMQTLWLGPYFLTLPDVLKGLKIIKNPEKVALTLRGNNGKNEIISLSGQSWVFTGFPKLPKLKTTNQPLFLSNTNDNYWSKFLPKQNAMYVQFNLVQQKKEILLKDFNVQLRKDLQQNKSKNLILDLRFNSGGNGSIYPPMLKTLMEFEIKNPKGKIFVIIGRRTFSAAQNLLTEITKFTDAILVGEPSGSSPNFIGEAGWFKLPNSGLLGLVASQYHQTSKAEDFRNWIAPHIPVKLNSKDYFSGIDKELDVIYEVIKSLKK